MQNFEKFFLQSLIPTCTIHTVFSRVGPPSLPSFFFLRTPPFFLGHYHYSLYFQAQLCWGRMRSLKGLCMIIGEGEGGWPWDDRRISFFTKLIKLINLRFIKAYNMFFISGFSLIYINVKNCWDNIIFLNNRWFKMS